MAGKWPLALKAAACGVSPSRLFIDAAQSGGAAGKADGLLCSACLTLPFEACRRPVDGALPPDHAASRPHFAVAGGA